MSRAVILAGGRGTRLHPFTITLPKPLVPIGDQPILEIVIRQLIACGLPTSRSPSITKPKSFAPISAKAAGGISKSTIRWRKNRSAPWRHCA